MRSAPEPAARTLGVSTHSLLTRDFDALARGSFEVHVLRQLAVAEVSRRRLAYRALLDILRADPPQSPLEPAAAAWDVLVRAEQRDPGAARAVMDQPIAGMWAFRLLRRLRGEQHDDLPLWVDLGHLHALASAAAARAGVEASLLVPVRRGVLHLPTLGSVRLPHHGPWETARVDIDSEGFQVTAAGLVRVNRRGFGAETDQWLPIRAIRATSFVIEDTDPYRHAEQVVLPVRLPSDEVARWDHQLTAALDLLRLGHPALADGVDATVSVVVPSPGLQRFRSYSGTTGDAVGAVTMSWPPDPTDAAATLAHEFRHAVLCEVMHLVKLVDPAAAGSRYVPWRDDPRPPRGVLHGIYAFAGVAGFWRAERRRVAGVHAMLAHFEFALWRRAVLDTAVDLAASGDLTPLGQRFLTGVLTTVEGWLAEPVPVECRQLADLATADTAALWRAYHLRPEPVVVDRLARAWLAGAASAPAEPTATTTRLVPDPDARAFDTRACLARLWLADRTDFRRREAAGPAETYRGASLADCALVRGSIEQAASLYEADLAREPGNRRALVGLGLALGEADDAGRALRARPELVRAVGAAAREITSRHPSPRALAAWLAPVVS